MLSHSQTLATDLSRKIGARNNHVAGRPKTAEQRQTGTAAEGTHDLVAGNVMTVETSRLFQKLVLAMMSSFSVDKNGLHPEGFVPCRIDSFA
jgi:hypothetical protein